MLKLTITRSEFSKFKLIAILMGLLKEHKTLNITVTYPEKEEDERSESEQDREDLA